MSMRWPVVAFLCRSALAHADIAPPIHVQVCTVETQCRASEEGVSCVGSHVDRDRCEKQYAKNGYARRCKTYGASAWTEVWCRPKVKPKK